MCYHGVNAKIDSATRWNCTEISSFKRFDGGGDFYFAHYFKIAVVPQLG